MFSLRVCCVIFGLTSLLGAAGSKAQDLQRLKEVADSLAKEQNFSGAVLVAKGDKILLQKAYGDANREWAIPNSSNTRFRLGSITKQFTAAAILLLQERGKLKLDDQISRHISGLPDSWNTVTIQQLLTHTSGIHSFTDLPEYRNIERFAKSPEETLAPVRELPLDFPSGSQWNYSNSGYVLLGMLIEKLSNTSYEQFVQQNIFAPLGMKDSGYDTNAAIIPHRAAGYAATNLKLQNAEFIHMSVPFAAGALYSTTGDLLRWQTALYEGRLLSQSSVQAMTTAVPPGYGFGLMIMDGPEGKRYFHAGGIEGFSTLSSYRPTEKISVVILSNIENRELMWIELPLARVSLGQKVILPSERKTISLTHANLDELVGKYATSDGKWTLVRRNASQLSVRSGGQPWLPVTAESKDHFFARTMDVQFEFHRTQNGTVDGLTTLQFGEAQRMSRIVESDPDYAHVPFFLRGEMNNWGLNDVMKSTVHKVYSVDLQLNKGRHLFKFGSEDFKAIDFGAASGDESVVQGVAKTLEALGENLQFEVSASGKFRFNLDTNDVHAPKLTVTRLP
ncbi:serine hydrolase [Pseudoduganella danionis]|uniref:Serine hydrolase n=1 Tax=Pseudoduganella danionis TaxID=1890295 RepID=A0ABW9SPB6_9BURK|nr:serine hydrolase [Pseudoduganella danionis]MTW33705.1 serine hydrolase [Pseudoduganella danionis]